MKIKCIDTRNELVDRWSKETYENYRYWHRNTLDMDERNMKIKRIDTRNELVDQWTNETYEN